MRAIVSETYGPPDVLHLEDGLGHLLPESRLRQLMPLAGTILVAARHVAHDAHDRHAIE